MKTFLIAVVVLLFYVHLFNVLATKYFESGQPFSVHDMYRGIVPPMKITIEV